MDSDYPSHRWFWQHIDKPGRKRALAELWALRHFTPWGPQRNEQEFWQASEIGRIEGNLEDIPKRLTRPDAELLAEVLVAQAERLAAWMAWTPGAIDERMKRRRIPGEFKE